MKVQTALKGLTNLMRIFCTNHIKKQIPFNIIVKGLDEIQFKNYTINGREENVWTLFCR